MKKTFLSLIVLLCGLTGTSAQINLSLTNLDKDWGGASYNAATQTITFTQGWGACGWNINADYSDYDEVCVTFADDVPCKTILMAEYGNGSTTKPEITSGKEITLTLDATGKSSVVYIVLQTELAATLTLVSAVVRATGGSSEGGGETPADVDVVLVTGTADNVGNTNNSGGSANIDVSSVTDPGSKFAHNVLKFNYSMPSDDAYFNRLLPTDANFSSPAGATGYAFWYRTESTADSLCMYFEANEAQQGFQLPATNGVWTYYYFSDSHAASSSQSLLFYLNGAKDGKRTGTATGTFYMSEVRATTHTTSEVSTPTDLHIATSEIRKTGHNLYRLGETAVYRIFSLTGEVMISAVDSQIDLNQLPQGLYILKTGQQTVKLIKE